MLTISINTKFVISSEEVLFLFCGKIVIHRMGIMCYCVCVMSNRMGIMMSNYWVRVVSRGKSMTILSISL